MTLQKITLNVDGMSCGHCSGMVKKTLEEIDGVSNVSVSLDEKKAFFDADTSDLIDKAIKEVTEAGYKASNA
ncbi:MAG: heavy-metal-associated domain-containing protein [Proteobacteria bacterium]|nr:heavy-metal-associated domain-containing protein [Pseudomonadota bacterium]MBU1695663.1 heavy-metal-associated domain-containing protein [Pseudomonadota bacterium]